MKAEYTMQAIYEALGSRAGEITGNRATSEEVAQLASRLEGPEFATLLRIFRDFPVCGMGVAFTLDSDKNAAPPADESDSEIEYDSEYDHEFDWLSAAQVLDEIDNALAGPVALRAGFVPIGMCAMGGDGYFLRILTPQKAPVGLYRVYYDWYDADRGVLVMPDAVNLVSSSFDQALRVARFDRGLLQPNP